MTGVRAPKIGACQNAHLRWATRTWIKLRLQLRLSCTGMYSS